MDGYREHPGDFEPAAASEPARKADPAADVAAAIGSDERRMHVRAYNYWVSLLDGRDFPSIEDLEPGDVEDFSANSVLLDFTSGGEDPATPYIGTAIREECGLGDGIKSIADVPSRSLLSRLTDHYMQIIANRAPVGFEAEFVNQRGQPICYRGILMPFSSDGDTIDFIYGVISWKQAAPAADMPFVPRADPAVDELADEPLELDMAMIAGIDREAAADEPLDLDSPCGVEPEAVVDEPAPDIALAEDAGLADRLWAARECAEAAKAADGRTRAALYRALSEAYDFALTARRNPEDYSELLEESGVKAQARAPMTPIVKLIFGVDYDKTRLTEFAAALSYAQRRDVALGGFMALIEAQAGGLKALVAAERTARRPEPKADDAGERARARLRIAQAIELGALPAEEEFRLVLTRRSPAGGYEAVALVEDGAMIERAIRKLA